MATCVIQHMLFYSDKEGACGMYPHLGGLATSGFSDEDHALVRAQCLHEARLVFRNRQLATLFKDIVEALRVWAHGVGIHGTRWWSDINCSRSRAAEKTLSHQLKLK